MVYLFHVLWPFGRPQVTVVAKIFSHPLGAGIAPVENARSQVTQHFLEALLLFKTPNNENRGLFTLLLICRRNTLWKNLIGEHVHLISLGKKGRYSELSEHLQPLEGERLRPGKAEQVRLQLYNQNHCWPLIVFLVIVDWSVIWW